MDMPNISDDNIELSPTYRTLTADRLLEHFGIKLNPETLQAAIKNPQSIYFHILTVPFKHIINGIVLQQAEDYQIYAQKMFVDYLVSGSGNETPEETPGEAIRLDLEANRKKLVEMNEQFEDETSAHKTLICETQAQLKELIKKLLPEQVNETEAAKLEQAMRPYRERAEELSAKLCNRRAAFKDLILDTNRLIQLLPDFHASDTLEEKNKEALQFDDNLGM